MLLLFATGVAGIAVVVAADEPVELPDESDISLVAATTTAVPVAAFELHLVFDK